MVVSALVWLTESNEWFVPGDFSQPDQAPAPRWLGYAVDGPHLFLRNTVERFMPMNVLATNETAIQRKPVEVGCSEGSASRRTEDCRINRQQASNERQLTAIKQSGNELHQALASRTRWKNFMHGLSWITKGFDSSVPVVSIARLDSSRRAFLFAVCWFQSIRFAESVRRSSDQIFSKWNLKR
jgi:hypothetical protein